MTLATPRKEVFNCQMQRDTGGVSSLLIRLMYVAIRESQFRPDFFKIIDWLFYQIAEPLTGFFNHPRASCTVNVCPPLPTDACERNEQAN
jgi:hypothetical protein